MCLCTTFPLPIMPRHPTVQPHVPLPLCSGFEIIFQTTLKRVISSPHNSSQEEEISQPHMKIIYLVCHLEHLEESNGDGEHSTVNQVHAEVLESQRLRRDLWLDKKLKIYISVHFSNLCSLKENYFCARTNRLIHVSISFTKVLHCVAQEVIAN